MDGAAGQWAKGEKLEVDVVIACHDPRRRVGRAARSVLADPRVRTRITVVSHNTDRAGMLEALGRDDVQADERVRVLELHDGIRSPAGPFNLGIAEATAPYVSVMGSDDWLEPGAVASWLRLARASRASAVVPRLRHAGGSVVPTPVARPGRRSALDPVRDRLAYRSAPLGLVARSEVDRLGLRMTAGLASGEDIAFSTRLWFFGHDAVLDRKGPAYVVGDDAESRVTFTPRGIVDEFGFLDGLVAEPWFAELPLGARQALVTKILRVHVFGAVLNRPDPGWWVPAERAALRDVATTLLAIAPAGCAPLAVADRRLLDAVLDPDVPAGALVRLATARRRFGTPATLVPRDARRLLHREAPLRFMAASVLAGR